MGETVTLPRSAATAGAIFALLAVFAIICLWSHLGEDRRALAGFWVGDQAFLDESGLDDMYLMILPGELDYRGAGLAAASGAARYQGYLFMSVGGEPVWSRAFTLRTNLGHGFWRRRAADAAAELVFDDADDPPWPEDLRLVLADGTLAVHDGAELLAFLTKIHRVDPDEPI